MKRARARGRERKRERGEESARERRDHYTWVISHIIPHISNSYMLQTLDLTLTNLKAHNGNSVNTHVCFGVRHRVVCEKNKKTKCFDFQFKEEHKEHPIRIDSKWLPFSRVYCLSISFESISPSLSLSLIRTSAKLIVSIVSFRLHSSAFYFTY